MNLEMTSQTWEGIDWTHQLQVYQPKDTAPNAVMPLYNTGGKANDANIAFGMVWPNKSAPRAPFSTAFPISPFSVVKRRTH